VAILPVLIITPTPLLDFHPRGGRYRRGLAAMFAQPKPQGKLTSGWPACSGDAG
jgi:hypothetical protein